MPRPASATLPVVMLLTVLFAASGVLAPLQRMIGDARFALATRAPSGRVVQVDIDGASIQALGVWPWSRATHAAILDQLKALGAGDVAFDVDFSSRSSPEGDDAFEAALDRADGTTILAALQQDRAVGPAGAAPVESHPLPRFATHAWEGSVNVMPDPDGRVRWLAREQAFAKGPLPGLAALLAGEPGTPTGFFMADFGIDARRVMHVSAIDLLRNEVSAERIAGKKVIVGATALELRDYYQVPRFGFLPGATVQAVALDSLLQGRALQPTGAILTTVLSAAAILGVGIAARSLPFASRLVLFAAVSLIVELAALVWQTLWPVVPVTAALQGGLAAFGLITIASEIIDRRTRLRSSRRRARRLAATLDRVIADNFAGIVVVDQEGLVRAVSAVAVRLLGPAMEQAAGQRFETVLPAPLVSVLNEVLARARNGRFETAETRELQCPDRHGSQIVLECVSTVSPTIEGEASSDPARPEFAACLTFQDVTEKRATDARLAQMAHVDFLSGLANRFVLLSALATRGAQQREGTSGLLLFDVDHFRRVNDRFGHAAGDALIQAVAKRLADAGSPGDLLARLGGDEFAVFASRRSPDDLIGFAETLVRAVGGLYEVQAFTTAVSVSLGLVIDEGQDAKDLMAAADAAHYAAKAAGGDRLQVYDRAMRSQAEETKRLAEDLRAALARGEISVAYQRQVDVRTEAIIGVEALARWTHPERGPVSPGLFIPVAEQTGLIEVLGAWVLAEACRAAAAWPMPIKVSVNLSAVQLARPDLATRIQTVLTETGLEPKRLDLELTESLLMENNDVVRATLEALRAAGVHISLDDFGTGYSSLSYLRTFPIDKVKIDQSFIRDLAGVSSSAIVRAVVGLAQELGFRVNAEGVETVEQLQRLRALGCDEVQGYLHGRPEPSSAIAVDLEQQLRRQMRAAE